MWSVLAATRPALFFTPKQSQPPISVAAAGNYQPSRHQRPSPVRKQRQQIPKHKEEKENETQKKGAVTNQLSGLDVLWAMQKAAAEKNRTGRGTKRNRRGEGLVSSSSGRKEEESVDYSNIRPLSIKSDWGDRLDDLEKRLQILSHKK